MKHYELLREDDSEFPLLFKTYLAVERIYATVKVVLEIDDIEIDIAASDFNSAFSNNQTVIGFIIDDLKERLREALPYQIEKLERVIATLKKVQGVGDVK